MPGLDIPKTGLRACQACRTAKVRCDSQTGDATCLRCRENGLPCVWLPSKRGRIKGSKNRRTLERLDQYRKLWGEETPIAGPSRPRLGLDDIVSPVDAFWNTSSSLSSDERPLHRDSVMAQLEKSFPVDRGVAAESAFSGSYEKDLQNPLLFLAECARNGWKTDEGTDPAPPILPAANTPLPPGDFTLLRAWSSDELQNVFEDQRTFFQLGLHGSRRDVGAGLDAVQRGVIKEAEVGELFQAFFRDCHPQWPILDPESHSPSYVRQRSAYLFTVILAIGATSIALFPGATDGQSQRAKRLHSHMEKLQLVQCATAAKSIEIVQAEQLLQGGALRKPRLIDDTRWARMGWNNRLSVAIGLQRGRPNDMVLDSEARNEFRCRLGLLLGESRWESITDRKPIPPELQPLSRSEMAYLDQVDPLATDAMLAAEYELYRFETESKERLGRLASDQLSLAFDAERTWIITYLDQWDKRWCEPQIDTITKWHFRYSMLRSKIIGMLRIANLRAPRWTPATRQDLLDVCIELLEGALSNERSAHMLRVTSPLVFACFMILRLTGSESPSRDLVLRMALRLAGEPGRGVMTFSKHNGLQLINMLCLSEETRAQRRAAATSPTIPTMPLGMPEPVLSFDQNANLVPQDANGFADLEQLLNYGGNIDFPYIPDPTLSLPWDISMWDPGSMFLDTQSQDLSRDTFGL